MNITVVEVPPFEPVSIAEAYEHLRWDAEEEGSPPEAVYPLQSLIDRNIASARAYCEQVTRRAFVEQTIRLSGPGFPVMNVAFSRNHDDYESRTGWVELLRPPLLEVVSVQYYDTGRVLQTVSPSNYFTTDDLVPRLMFAENYAVPCTYRRDDAFRVTYRVGYTPEGSPPSSQAEYTANIPQGIKDSILIGVQLLSDRFDASEREDLERTRDNLLASYRIHTF